MSRDAELRWHQQERNRKRRLDQEFESDLQQEERSTGSWSTATRQMEADAREQRAIGRALQLELTQGERVEGARATRAGKRGL